MERNLSYDELNDKQTSMKILIATDSFKDALPASAVCDAIEKGIKLVDKNIETAKLPLADGGEGTMEVLMNNADGQWQTLTVHDPLMRPIEARYGLSKDGKTAFIEMAAASGLELLSTTERNPLQTTSFGTGELIKAAVAKGAKEIVLAIGGSATNDAGMGIAAALGYRFLDIQENELLPVGKSLQNVCKIADDNFIFKDVPPSEQVSIKVICDVTNPLYGPQGAASIYAPQKGATQDMVKALDNGLKHFSLKLEKKFGKNIATLPGAGAAGGVGAGAVAFLDATLYRGVDLVLDYVGFEQQLNEVDFIITGEGKLDHQTESGKLIYGLTQRAKKHSIPVIALCGALEAAPMALKKMGIQAAFSIQQQPVSLSNALQNTSTNLTTSAFNVVRLLSKI